MKAKKRKKRKVSRRTEVLFARGHKKTLAMRKLRKRKDVQELLAMAERSGYIRGFEACKNNG